MACYAVKSPIAHCAGVFVVSPRPRELVPIVVYSLVDVLNVVVCVVVVGDKFEVV